MPIGGAGGIFSFLPGTQLCKSYPVAVNAKMPKPGPTTKGQSDNVQSTIRARDYGGQ